MPCNRLQGLLIIFFTLVRLCIARPLSTVHCSQPRALHTLLTPTLIDDISVGFSRAVHLQWKKWVDAEATHVQEMQNCDFGNYVLLLQAACVKEVSETLQEYRTVLTVHIHNCSQGGQITVDIKTSNETNKTGPVYRITSFNFTLGSAYTGAFIPVERRLLTSSTEVESPTPSPSEFETSTPSPTEFETPTPSPTEFETPTPSPTTYLDDTGVNNIGEGGRLGVCEKVDITDSNPYLQHYTNASVWLFAEILDNGLSRLEPSDCEPQGVEFYVQVEEACVQVDYYDADYFLTITVVLPQCGLQSGITGRFSVPTTRVEALPMMIDYDFIDEESPWQAIDNQVRRKLASGFFSGKQPPEQLSESSHRRMMKSAGVTFDDVPTVVDAYQQCGGKYGQDCDQRSCTDAPWENYECIPEWLCTRVSAAYWQCKPHPIINDPKFVPGWQQCGGLYGPGCKGNGGTRDCKNAPWEGYTCQKEFACVSQNNPAYWQCQPGAAPSNNPFFCPPPSDDPSAFQPIANDLLRTGDALLEATLGFQLGRSAKKFKLPSKCKSPKKKSFYVVDVSEGCSQPLKVGQFQTAYRFVVELPVCGYRAVAAVLLTKPGAGSTQLTFVDGSLGQWTKIPSLGQCVGFPSAVGDSKFKEVPKSVANALLVWGANQVWAQRKMTIASQTSCDVSRAELVEVQAACVKVEANRATYLVNFSATGLECLTGNANSVTGSTSIQFPRPYTAADPVVLSFTTGSLTFETPLEPQPFNIPTNVEIVGTLGDEPNRRRLLGSTRTVYKWKSRPSSLRRGVCISRVRRC